MRSVKAAAVQLSPVLYSHEGTVEKIVRTIHELGRQRVQFATFPETEGIAQMRAQAFADRRSDGIVLSAASEHPNNSFSF